MSESPAGVALADDLLEGADQIAEFLYGDPKKRRKVYHIFSETKSNNKAPLFRMGSIICGRRSTLMKWISDQEKMAMNGEGRGGGATHGTAT